jgi:hypothetical protein
MNSSIPKQLICGAVAMLAFSILAGTPAGAQRRSPIELNPVEELT